MPLIENAYKYFGDTLYNPNIGDLATYKKILSTDSIVTYAYDLIRRGVVDRIGKYSNENEEIREYVNTYVIQKLIDASKEILSAIYWGMSISELVKDKENGYITLRKIATASSNLWWNSAPIDYDEFGDPQKITITGAGTFNIFDKNNIRQLCLYTYRPEYCNQFGYATARQVYPYWYIKSRLLKFYAMYLEKFGIPSAVFNSNGDAEKIIDNYKELGSNSVMVVDETTEFKLIESSHNAGEEFIKAIELLDKYILMCFYIPKLSVDEGKYSTRSQADTHLDVYLKMETNLVNDFCDWSIEQVVKPLVQLNFGNQDNYGTILVNDAMPTTLMEYANIFKNLFDANILNGSEEEITKIKEMIGIDI